MNAPAVPPPSTLPGGAPASPGGAPTDPGPTIADVLSQLADLRSSVDGRFGKLGQDLGSLRLKVKGGAPSSDPAPEAQPTAPGTVTQSDLAAALKLGEVKAKLPADAQERIASLIEAGRSYADALTLAEAMAEGIASATGSQSSSGGVTPPTGHTGVTPPRPPTGTSATPAHSPVVPLPATFTELQALARKDQARYKAVMATDGFDPYKLPLR